MILCLKAEIVRRFLFFLGRISSKTLIELEFKNKFNKNICPIKENHSISSITTLDSASPVDTVIGLTAKKYTCIAL